MEPQQRLETPRQEQQLGTILIVDDEQVVRDLCSRALGSYNVCQATSSSEALQLYVSERPDLVLTDVMMPGENGIDLLRRIKEIDLNSVVIIMTGFSEREIILNALREGADDFINKPLNLLQLKTAVEKSLARKRLKEELANLKRLDRLKSNFLSLISHKLRTPITSISLFLQNLEQGICDPDDPGFRATTQLVNNEVSYLGRLVADLLTFSQVMIEEGELKTRESDLLAVVEGTLKKNPQYLHRVTLQADCLPPLVNIDAPKIEFAIQQVIDNACKFSDPATQVIVSVAVVGELAVVTVTDAGPGIPEEEIAKVFEKFYQIDPVNSGQVRGFGLGLFYAREFVGQNRGDIRIESRVGLYTTVTIRLPLHHHIPCPAEASSQAHGRSAKD